MIVDTSLLMLDLDHSKIVNDCYGHLVGDEVLRILANTLKTELRTNDLVGRLGGEEFTILLPDTSIDRTFELRRRGIVCIILEKADQVRNRKKPRLPGRSTASFRQGGLQAAPLGGVRVNRLKRHRAVAPGTTRSPSATRRWSWPRQSDWITWAHRGFSGDLALD